MTVLQCGKEWKTSPVTRHHPPALWRINNWQMIWMSSIAGLKKTPFTPATPTSPTPALQKDREKEGTGPDGVTPACLKTCADQLAPIFTQILNTSLELCEVPSCFKRSTIIPVPKKPKITGLNDYRPVALTSVVMKSFERLVLAYLKDTTSKKPSVCLQTGG